MVKRKAKQIKEDERVHVCVANITKVYMSFRYRFLYILYAQASIYI